MATTFCFAVERMDGWQGTVRSLKTINGAYNAC